MGEALPAAARMQHGLPDPLPPAYVSGRYGWSCGHSHSPCSDPRADLTATGGVLVTWTSARIPLSLLKLFRLD